MEYGRLDLADVAMLDVFNPAAVQTDKMVMFGKVREFVVRVIVAQINLMDNAFCFKRGERPVDRRLVDATRKLGDNFLGRKRPFRFLKNF
jgi:hypothetical protein